MDLGRSKTSESVNKIYEFTCLMITSVWLAATVHMLAGYVVR